MGIFVAVTNSIFRRCETAVHANRHLLLLPLQSHTNTAYHAAPAYAREMSYTLMSAAASAGACPYLITANDCAWNSSIVSHQPAGSTSSPQCHSWRATTALGHAYR